MKKQITITPTLDDHRITWLAAIAIAIHIIESTIPTPIPGIKFGFANIITVLVLFNYGLSYALWVTLLRVIVGSLLIGSFLSPTFMLSLSGSILSMAVLTVVFYIPGRGFSAIGISLLASMAHLLGQFIVVYHVFIPHQDLWRLFPIMLTMAIITGIFNGIICQRLIQSQQRAVSATT